MTTPKSIGRYEIIDEIGHGAMGVVYLAHDPRIDRRVAIKTIHALEVLPDAEAEEVRQRFTREAQAAGRLQHPGIVTIFDVGEHDGTWFIAMEYIEGETLERFTRKDHLLPPPQVLGLIVQACDALDYAHQQHIVHRDIKPANLMLLRNGRLKITDFGLAKNPHTTLTLEGILIGTPNYMSPEQVMGRPLDGRSDLFSLAAVLYELLSGERPFPGDSVTTIIYRILNEHPEPPQVGGKGIPPGLATVLKKALAKEPEQRYQTGVELAAALEGRAVQVMAEGIGAARPIRTTARPASGANTMAGSPPGAPAAAVATATAVPAGVRAQPARAREARPVVTAVPAARPAASRARAVLIALGALALVLLLPAAGTIDDRWGLGGSGGSQPFYRTAVIVGGAAGGGGETASPGPTGAGTSQASLAPPAVALPGGGDSIGITWRTTPPGGRIYVDDVETPGGVVRLPKGDRASHTVVAENDCFIDTMTWRAGDDRDGTTHTIALKTPKVAKVPLTSQPPGAKILLDGRDTSRLTPADLSLPVCETHTVSLRLEGYKEAERRLEKPGEAVTLSLARLPSGFVKIAAPYPVSVFENGKPIGSAGSPIRLTGGAHKLLLKNDDLFVEKNLTVTVQADRTTAVDAGLPGTGTLTVLASPSNCSISVNGRDLGPPPINDYQLAAGTYSIKAVYVPTGESKTASVTIAAGAGARVPFKFSP